MVQRNQDKILNNAEHMIKLANDSGERLLKLKDDVQKNYGRVWKEWAQTPGNLPIGYEQATRYMKLASASDQEFDQITSTSIEGAVKQIEHMRKPEKAKAAADKKAKKSAIPKATVGIISNATIEEIERCNSVSELRGVIKLAHARIEVLQGEGNDDENEPIDAESTEIEDKEDALEAIS
jgi:hypothetical protein